MSQSQRKVSWVDEKACCRQSYSGAQYGVLFLLGRILVFYMSDDREVQLVSEKGTKGAVYVLNAFNGKLLAGINNKVQLYRWADKDGASELQSECGHHGHVLALYMQSRGDFIVVGDLMRSIT